MAKEKRKEPIEKALWKAANYGESGEGDNR